MRAIRNTPTAFRFDPSVKEALAVISDRDGRSMANMLEWLIKKHCEREGLGWPPIRDQDGALPSGVPQTDRAAQKKVASSKNKK